MLSSGFFYFVVTTQVDCFLAVWPLLPAFLFDLFELHLSTSPPVFQDGIVLLSLSSFQEQSADHRVSQAAGAQLHAVRAEAAAPPGPAGWSTLVNSLCQAREGEDTRCQLLLVTWKQSLSTQIRNAFSADINQPINNVRKKRKGEWKAAAGCCFWSAWDLSQGLVWLNWAGRFAWHKCAVQSYLRFGYQDASSESPRAW